MTSKNTTSTTRIALSPTLRTIKAVEGIQQLRTLHEKFGIIPDPTLVTQLDRLEQLFAENDLTIEALVRDQATVLTMATGVPATAVTRIHASETAEKLHEARNLIVAIAAAGAAAMEVDSPNTAPAAIYSNSIKLARRSAQIRRPFASDEILLCRVAAHLAARHDPRNQSATVYTLTEAGLTPGETTQFTITDVDDPELPRQLLAAGNGHLAARFIELDQFSSHTLARHFEHALRAGHRPTAPLTFRPRKHQPGSASATASAQRTLDRFLAELRIPTGDITASSITQWRVGSMLDRHGENAALALSGRATLEQMYRALGRSPVATTAPRGEAISFLSLV